ncbi:hypothetical protein Agub_g722, partial [Astrephomene gubernaculifera]
MATARLPTHGRRFRPAILIAISPHPLCARSFRARAATSLGHRCVASHAAPAPAPAPAAHTSPWGTPAPPPGAPTRVRLRLLAPPPAAPCPQPSRAALLAACAGGAFGCSPGSCTSLSGKSSVSVSSSSGISSTGCVTSRGPLARRPLPQGRAAAAGAAAAAARRSGAVPAPRNSRASEPATAPEPPHTAGSGSGSGPGPRRVAAAGPTVVVVESPTKAKKIQAFLGDQYTVLASFGHIRDLPPREGSVRPEAGWSLAWQLLRGAEGRLGAVEAALRAGGRLLLATDPDREGEAISWHIEQELRARGVLRPSSAVQRISFTEVTRAAVTAALGAGRQVSQPLVDAYLARRCLDYLVGFNISPVLWRRLPGARSAGRVQSVALRLVCEREGALEGFT